MANTKGLGANKLSSEHKIILIQLLADFYGNDEVIEYFKLEYDIEMVSSNVSFYRKNKEKEIIETRKKLNERLLAIPIANKFYRLEHRQKLLDDLEDNLWYEDYKIKNNQIAYDGNGKPIMLKIKGNHGAANQIMDSVQKETEPDKLAFTDPSGENEFTGFTDDERRMERLAELCNAIRERRSSEAGK